MNRHTLRLHPDPFLKILDGNKTIESRLHDAKRQKFQVGDELIFINREDKNEISTTITRLHRFPYFLDMFQSLPLEKFGGGSPQSLLQEIKTFYSDDDQTLYGVVGIEFTVN